MEQDQLVQHIGALVFFLSLSLIFLGAAYYKKFFISLSDRLIPPAFSLGNVLWGFAIYFLVQAVIFPIFAVMVAGIYYRKTGVPQSILTDSHNQALVMVLSLLVGFLAVLIYCRWLGREKWNFIWFKGEQNSAKKTFQAIAIGFLAWFIAFPLVGGLDQMIEVIQNILHIQPTDQKAIKFLKDLHTNPALFFFTAFTFSVATPIAEELVFRGLLQTRFRSMLQPISAIIVTSGIFAAFHFSVDQGFSNVQLLASLFLLSCFLGYIYERQRNLWAPITLHICFNSLSILMLSFQEGMIVTN